MAEGRAQVSVFSGEGIGLNAQKNPHYVCIYYQVHSVGHLWLQAACSRFRLPCFLVTVYTLTAAVQKVLGSNPSWIPDFFPWIYFSLSQQKHQYTCEIMFTFLPSILFSRSHILYLLFSCKTIFFCCKKLPLMIIL